MGLTALGLLALLAAAPASLDAALVALWKASSPKEAAKAAAAVKAAGASFDEVYARLKAGRPYSDAVDRGSLRWAGHVGGGPLEAVEVEIPSDYDPGRRYPVRVFLHGGVGRPAADASEALPALRRPRRRLQSEGPLITLHPAGFLDAQWWFANQVENVALLLDRLKRSYNVDENRIQLMGVSDGGTGAYFFGMRSASAWSVLFPLNGSLQVLANLATHADGELFASNLVNTPIYAVNGGRDPLYPAATVVPYLELFARAGASVTFRPQAEAGHDTSWWPAERPHADAFANAHPRDPLPDRLSWRTERTDRYNRFRWLVIDALGASGSQSPLDDPNTIEVQDPLDFGLRVDSTSGDPRKVVVVVEKTSAAAMGLRPGDRIVEMDGAPIGGADDIGRAFDSHLPGTPLKFAVERRGQRLEMAAEFPPRRKAPRREQAFSRSRRSGRIDLVRTGNGVEVESAGVAAFTLLLSPEEFDFGEPVRVTVNGKAAFEGKLEKSVATLLEWAARDNDRTALFAAALKVEVP